MNRSAQPLPSGSRTKAGELSMPRKRISAWKSWLTYWLPGSWGRRTPAAACLGDGPRGDVLGEGAEALAHRLPDRLERLEAVSAAAGVDADALGRAVVDRHEHGRLALAGHHRGQVGPPHEIDPLGGDRAVVSFWAAPAPGALMRQEAVLAR